MVLTSVDSQAAALLIRTGKSGRLAQTECQIGARSVFADLLIFDYGIIY
jgi:hypothetical protein